MNVPSINVFNETIAAPTLNTEALTRVVKTMAEDFQKQFQSINFIILKTEEHTQMNAQYLDHHYETDVITFDLSSDQKAMGEVYINLDVATENAVEFNATPETELQRLAIHGVLHLMGLDDKTTEQQNEMREKEDFYLESFM